MNNFQMKRSQFSVLIASLILACGCSADIPAPTSDSSANAFCRSALDAAQVQLGGFLKAYPDPQKIARSYENGKAKIVSPKDWTSGFVAGSFWYMYEFSQDPAWLAAAEKSRRRWARAMQSYLAKQGWRNRIAT